jgi:prenyltransferase beta subunit
MRPLPATTLVLLVALLALSAIARAQTRPAANAGGQPAARLGIAAQPNAVRGDEITPAQQQAVEKGLRWLAAHQNPDGSFGARESGYSAHSAVTALSALAFMSAGNLPGRGPYGDNVKKATDYILRSAQESGLLSADASHGVMYSHGFATLFLAEVYGMTGNEDVKEKLQKAVRLIQKCQNREGGWRYMPVPYDADISVTISQVMALRAARDAGIKVEKDVIDKAVAYVRRCQNPDGGFSYMANDMAGGGGSGFERSAAGVATLYYAGIFEGDDIQRGLEYLKQFTPHNKGNAPQTVAHYFYGQYYGVQAMFLAGGDYWAAWYPAIREELIAKQDKVNGCWRGEVSEEYCTACALIVLQMPNRYLPVFSGKGPGG